MRVFKLVDHNLLLWQCKYNYDTLQYERREVTPGIRVCSRTKLSSVGVVVDVGKKESRYQFSVEKYVLKVTVLWLTGPRAGKREVRDTLGIVNFDSYKAAVTRHLQELEKYQTEAAQAGM